MSPKTAITLLVFTAIVPAARGDVDIHPPYRAMFKTDPTSSPRDSLIYSNGWDLSVAYWDPGHPTTSVVVQAGMTFNLLNLSDYKDADVLAYRLVLTTQTYTNPYAYLNLPIRANVTYGTTDSPAFTVPDFFRSSPPSGVVGAAVIPAFAAWDLAVSFDVTSILRNARLHTQDYPYLKFWVTAPNWGFWNFVPTLRLVGVPEPSTIVLLGGGLPGIGLVGLRSKRKRRDQAG